MVVLENAARIAGEQESEDGQDRYAQIRPWGWL
jgi:hypothetical protein